MSLKESVLVLHRLFRCHYNTVSPCKENDYLIFVKNRAQADVTASVSCCLRTRLSREHILHTVTLKLTLTFFFILATFFLGV